MADKATDALEDGMAGFHRTASREKCGVDVTVQEESLWGPGVGFGEKE